MRRILTVIAALALLAPNPAMAFQAKKGPLMTRWAAQVDIAQPLPDYPRPQLVRPDWLNLNGVWQFKPGAEGDAPPFEQDLPGEILVPFPVESALSGVMEHHDRIWYRRSFTVSPAWTGKHVLLHFGAVDYESETYINGKSLGIHKGGYDPFDYDITSLLRANGNQEIVVRIFNPVQKGGQPRGKQTTNPGSITYAPSTGIWQTVWLEPVSATSIKNLKIVPDVDGGKLRVTAEATGADATVTVVAKEGDAVVGSVTGKPGSELEIAVPNAKLWSPESPFLYDLDVRLKQGGVEVDRVGSYFGMRKIAIGDEGGVKKMFLNGKFVFQIGPLDQGYWPDGLYTAPTEAAMKYDIEQMKALGFNMVRKHIKVEPARWYYWTDKLGLLVWQDMPAANSYLLKDDVRPPVDTAEYMSELDRMIRTHWNAPSIIMWDAFNEGNGQQAFDTAQVVSTIKTLDPTRLVNEASGGHRFGTGDIWDIHQYPAPACPAPDAHQALACGEYGGIGLRMPGHLWREQGYRANIRLSTPMDLVYVYADYMDVLKGFRDRQGMSAAVYTEITDVETELNGLMTYDRVLKCDPNAIRAANHFQFSAPTYKPVLLTSETQTPQVWKYTFEKPAGNWNAAGFNDSAWKEGLAGFGKFQKWGATPWPAKDIWLRKHFNPGPLTAEQIANLVVKEFYTERVEVFINGVLGSSTGGPRDNYAFLPLSTEAQAAIVPNADNVIAVHALRKNGNQYIDAGLYIRIPGGTATGGK
jgi:hypothetical protein